MSIKGGKENVLVMGCGPAGSQHARMLSRLGHSVILHDIDDGKAMALRVAIMEQEQPVLTPRWVPDASAVGTDFLACVVVATPTHTHAGIIIEQLAMGRTVVCEKPLALTEQDITMVVRAALDAEEVHQAPKLYVAESQGYHPDLPTMKRSIEAGAFGMPVQWQLSMMSSYKSQAWSYEMAGGGGAFLEGGVHMLTVARYLFGNAVAHTGAFVHTIGDAPDTGTMLVTYAPGHVVTLSIGWGTASLHSGVAHCPDNRCVLVGPKHATPFATDDDREPMWAALLDAMDAGEEARITLQMAAGACIDVVRAYENALLWMKGTVEI